MFELKNTSTVMEVTCLNGNFTYSLVDVSKDIPQPMLNVFSKVVNERVLMDYINSIYYIVEVEYDEEKLVKIGKLIYQLLIPEKLSTELKNLNKKQSGKLLAITIVSIRQDIPWELLFDEENFWGIKYEIGRRIVGYENSRQIIQKNDTYPYCLLIANPSEDLPESEKELYELMVFLREKNVKCNYLAHCEASVTEIMLELNSLKYDFIHYSGHIQRMAEGQYSFLLAKDNYLELNSISGLQGFGSPLVFLNACGSMVNAVDTKEGHHTNEGVVVPFIHAGACAVISTLWKVTDGGARYFAQKVYQNLINNMSFGEALAITRKEIMKEFPGDSAWTAFVLYGHPGMCFINAGQIPKLPEMLTREDFSYEAWKILIEAGNLASRSMIISTTHLFYALGYFKSSSIKSLFESIKVNIKDFDDILRKIIEDSEDNFKYKKDNVIRFSINSQKILVNAAVIASNKGQKIMIEDILEAFGNVPDAGINSIILSITHSLLKVGLDDAAFDKEGFLKKELFTEETIKSLNYALNLAGQESIVSTTHLFYGMLIRKESLLSEIFKKIGEEQKEYAVIYEKLTNIYKNISVIRIFNQIPIESFSENVYKILNELAKSVEKSGYRIDEKSILKRLLSINCSIAQILTKLSVSPDLILEQLNKHNKGE